MPEQDAVNLSGVGMIPSLENDDDLFFQFSNFGYDDSVVQPELLHPTATELSVKEDNPWLFLQGGGDWNPLFYLSQEEQNVLGISPDYDYDNNSVVTTSTTTTTTTTTTTSAHLISSAGNFSLFPPPSPTVSYISQLEAESSVSICPPPSPLVMPTASTNTRTNLQKTAGKKARKKLAEKQEQAQEEVVTFAVEGNGNTLYDGYFWRKYGKKNIKHRDFPRSYYRCGHGGCNVKKRVEQSSENPAQILIAYYGRHNHHPITGFSTNDGWWPKSRLE